MPYYVTEDAEGCAGYGVVKEDGELIGCHLTQQDAIDQMVAVSLDEGMEPGGMLEEREMSAPISTLRMAAPGIKLLRSPLRRRSHRLRRHPRQDHARRPPH
jgi:hypothetical protein